MPSVETTKRTDANGHLTVEHDFGARYAEQEVRITLELLAPSAQYRGSRNHILDLVSTNDFHDRMRNIIRLDSVVIDKQPNPVPSGFNSPAETDLDEYIRRHYGQEVVSRFKYANGRNWWAPYGGTRPQMDLICRARINDQPGILFLEAKAHEAELDWGGKPLADDASEGSVKNHKNITDQITSASKALDNLSDGFNLSVVSHYQLANRLTYLWKLASEGIPVVLLYLGFLNDEYFPADYLRDEAHWLRVMGGYLEGVVPQSFPEQVNILNGNSLAMLIRSVQCINKTPI